MKDKTHSEVIEAILKSPNIDPLFRRCLINDYERRHKQKKVLMVDRDILKPWGIE